MKRESMRRAALIGCLGGIPVAIFYEMFFLGPMRGNIGLALIEAITLAPSGAAAAFLAFHAHQRYGESPGAMLLALLSGVTVAVVAIAVLVYIGSQLGLFDAPAPNRIHLTLGVATGLFISYATFRRISEKNPRME
jgi:hypothetical protein